MASTRVATEVYGTIHGPRIGLTVTAGRAELTNIEALELVAELNERIDECEAEQRELEKARIQHLRDAYEDRKGALHV